MKKQIVITLTETNKGWTGEIYGKVDNKKTDTIYDSVQPKGVMSECGAVSGNIYKVIKWMEQIK